MPEKQTLIGQKFGRLTVISEAPRNKHNQAMWECLCSCGNKTTTRGYSLVRGDVKSCGCLRNIAYRKTHGQSSSRLYLVWQGIKKRCFTSSHKDFKHYGGRGIVVCDAWRNSFESFRDWALQNGYIEGLTIDRIDVNGNYEPDNCRWVDQKTQTRNKRSNAVYNGKCLSEWAEIVGIDYFTLHSRITKLGWSFEKAIRTPTSKR